MASTIKTIKFAAIPVSSFKNDANIGANNITIILEGEKDSRVNEIKRATTELTIALPTFDDVLEANASQNLWNEAKDTYTTRINGNSEISLVKPFISKKDANGVAFYDLNKADGSLKYELKYTDAAEKVQLIDITNANPKVLLGATKATWTSTYDVLNTYGLYYQWGRKDPSPLPPTYNYAQSDMTTKPFYYMDEGERQRVYRYLELYPTVEMGAVHPLDIVAPSQISQSYANDWLYASIDRLWGYNPGFHISLVQEVLQLLGNAVIHGLF